MICDLNLGGFMSSKTIAAIGFFAFIGIMGCLTAAFNWFWSGLGDDPSRYKILPLTNDLNEFKDYAALYIPLISFGATLFAGFVVFLVFSDWKEQHNKKIISDEAKQLLISVDKEILEFSNIVSNLKRLDPNKKIQSQYDEIFSQAVVSFNKTIDYSDNIGYLVSELSDDKEFEKIRKNYNLVTINLQKKFTEQLKNDELPTDILNTFEPIRKNFGILNKLYKNNIKRLIFA